MPRKDEISYREMDDLAEAMTPRILLNLQNNMQGLHDKMDTMRADIAALKVRSTFWGAVSGGIAAAITIAVQMAANWGASGKR